ncbi:MULTISPECIES: DUF3859 domain-containing protein [Pseudomonas]|uniref:DUF3859 domain-containing protein n=2 Tax=Ectopseudomonas TaxID=3236654 RepID=A0A653BBI8_ECTOL|nr:MULTISPECIES: DUF3859 domain-containing protein [Pseudomonas]TNF08810.1 MAG: DUF3859 domain-containing protein [Pseudomonadales bacterium]CAE6920954.1 Helicase subunit of the DNA excision repair complex [Pseudomonas oleovorans]QFT22114.1 hypothetical protein FIV02_11080 [Pseudomonas sp. THAF187a]QFT42301.1 hypothetical protein FIU98_11060 [Pseudomonas sp. THAF42]QTS88730.1 DUF3859 domain-containing protein [Pseudomonas khazarica]|tara:strand:+ start:2092 stop:2556 length:465 start_codon:yes stop_codon:yes gene_type:complete
MHHTRMTLIAGLLACSGLVQADVRVEGPVEYGVFSSQYKDFQPGERVLTRSNQDIERTEEIPARLGTKFGMRYSLAGKREGDLPLTLLYLTPGVVTPDGQRHDKFEVQQKLVVGAPQDVMAFEFTEHHEVVPGEWHFIVYQGDRKLAEQRFQVR